MEATPANNTQTQQQEKPRQAPKPKEAGRGVVKSVLSGDTILVIHIEKNQQGPPVEREITLTNIAAPKLGRRKRRNDDSTFQEDAPFAWQSREYLRKKLVGNQVTYTVENKDPKSGKEYGTVYFGAESENVAKTLLSEGWVKLRANVRRDRSEIEDLVAAEEAAEKAGKGVWNEDEKAIAASKRPLDKEVNNVQVYEKSKGKPQPAVVESVVTGSRLRLTLQQSLQSVELLLSGVEAPNVQDGKEPEPFAREAKFFTEHWLLNRDVQVLLEGADKFILYGSIASGPFNISEELLKNGLGKLVEWSAARTTFADKLRAAEKSAKDKKVRVWANYKAEATSGKAEENKNGKEINGRVTKVINGGGVTVVDQNGGSYDVFLSSVKLPKQPSLGKGEEKKTTETKEEAHDRSVAWEAKELMRKRLIGQRVRCVLDYVRPETKMAKETLPERPFYSVYLDKTNIAVELVDAGLASVQARKGGEERSRDFEFLLFAEERAKKANKGLHADPLKYNAVRINDLSARTPAAQATTKTLFPSLKRNGKMKAVVEYVFSGSRFKLYIPKEGIVVNFILGVAKTPSLGTVNQKVVEPYAEEAFKFTTNKALQHDVEVEILNQDKGGNFIGELWVNKRNMSTMLLEEGLATSLRMNARESEHAREYETAEENAKRMRKNLWKNYDPVAEEAKRRARFEEDQEKTKKTKQFNVKVTEVVNGNEFYVQIVNNDDQSKLEELMKNLAVEESEADPTFKPAFGALVKAKFSEDDTWYRAKVVKLQKDGSVDIKYVDFGNQENVQLSSLRRLDEQFTKLPQQAKLARLAFLKAPALEDDFGEDAAEYLSDLVFGRDLVANEEYQDGDALYLTVVDVESNEDVNAAMLSAGLSRLNNVRGKQYEHVISRLKEEENVARKKHNGVWHHGDIDSDDEDTPKKKPWGKK